ncbi:MAG: phage tail assembly protein [Treponema sp.]|nr:phage tail assembly protein [Treponema sp.]
MYQSEGYDPFKPETFVLRVPIRKGEVECKEITLRPPVLKDILRTDGHDPESVGYARALLSSLSGVPESVLDQLAPEDWAVLRVALTRTNMRFMGVINLLDKKDKKDGEGEADPTSAAAPTPPPNSEPTSAE